MGASSSGEAARHHAPEESRGWCGQGCGRELTSQQERRRLQGASTTSKIKDQRHRERYLENATGGASKTLDPKRPYSGRSPYGVGNDKGSNFKKGKLNHSADDISDRGYNGHTRGRKGAPPERKGSLTPTEDDGDDSSFENENEDWRMRRKISSDSPPSPSRSISNFSSDECCSQCSCFDEDLRVPGHSPSCSPPSDKRKLSGDQDYLDVLSRLQEKTISQHWKESVFKDSPNKEASRHLKEIPDAKFDVPPKSRDVHTKMSRQTLDNRDVCAKINTRKLQTGDTLSSISRSPAQSSRKFQSQTNSLPAFKTRSGNRGNSSVYRNPNHNHEFLTSKRRQVDGRFQDKALASQVSGIPNHHEDNVVLEETLKEEVVGSKTAKQQDPSLCLMSPQKLSTQYRDDASELKEVFGRIRQLREKNEEEALRRAFPDRVRPEPFKSDDQAIANVTKRQRSSEKIDRDKYFAVKDYELNSDNSRVVRDRSQERPERLQDSRRLKNDRPGETANRIDTRHRDRILSRQRAVDSDDAEEDKTLPDDMDNIHYPTIDRHSSKTRKDYKHGQAQQGPRNALVNNHNSSQHRLENGLDPIVDYDPGDTIDRPRGWRSKHRVNDYERSYYGSLKSDHHQDHYRWERDCLVRVEGHARDKGLREREPRMGRLEKVVEERDIYLEECTVPFVLAYDDLLSGPFKAFLDCSNQIGGDVATIAKLVQETFINQRAFLVMASKSQRPLDMELPQVLEPTGKKIQEVIGFRESKRQSPFFNHLSAVSESIPGLSWVAVAPAPGPYVKEMGDSAVFYTNRVLKEYREKDKLHVEWVQNWNNVFKELQSYVLAHHTTGLSWNTRGGNAMNNLKPAPPNCGVPPPPPPGNIPPPPPMVKLEPKVVPADDGRAALFESINKGSDITSGLKKVTDDMKTHKNPSLREGPKPFVKASTGGTNFTKEPSPPGGTPKLALEGKKWIVEFQKDKPNLLISQTRMDQCVYIYKCVNTVVQVKGKINNVILDSCKKSSVVFDNLVSSAEVVNCQSCQVQVMGVMPTLSIEKTDGCQVYLSKESLNTEVISAKSTAMNVLIPNDEGDFTECPIPEQFKTLVNGLSLTTTATEAAG